MEESTHCPFSVEVSMSQVSDRDLSLVSSHSSSASCIIHDDEEPALVPVGSCGGSDSDNSSHEDNRALVERPGGDSTQESSMQGSSQNPMHMQVTSDDVGMIECLSDQFSNMFCSADHHGVLYRCSGDTSTTDPHPFLPTCGVLDEGNSGSEVFASLNFWLSPSDEEKLTERTGKEPRNRVCARRHKATYVKHLWNHWHPDNKIPLERSKSMPDEPTPSVQDLQFEVFYDSDPESEHTERDARGRALVEPKPEPRRSFRSRRPPPIQTIYEDEHAMSQAAPVAPRNCRSLSPEAATPLVSSRPMLPQSPRSLNDYHLLDRQGDDFLRQYVHEVTNARPSLIWHRLPSKGGKRPIQAPVAVTGAFEVGAHLEQLVIQPKFTWSPAYEAELEKRKFCLSGGEPYSVELLSIIRVVKPTKLNRDLYPFARLDRTCCVSTNDERFPYLVFEAPSTRERDWLVTALKMIVARLASIIIVRDEARLLEFFSPYSAIMSLADGDEDLEDSPSNPSSPTITPEPPPPLNSQGDLQLLF